MICLVCYCSTVLMNNILYYPACDPVVQWLPSYKQARQWRVRSICYRGVWPPIKSTQMSSANNPDLTLVGLESLTSHKFYDTSNLIMHWSGWTYNKELERQCDCKECADPHLGGVIWLWSFCIASTVQSYLQDFLCTNRNGSNHLCQHYFNLPATEGSNNAVAPSVTKYINDNMWNVMKPHIYTLHGQAKYLWP
jgi:hypothetical protein